MVRVTLAELPRNMVLGWLALSHLKKKKNGQGSCSKLLLSTAGPMLDRVRWLSQRAEAREGGEGQKWQASVQGNTVLLPVLTKIEVPVWSASIYRIETRSTFISIVFSKNK